MNDGVRIEIVPSTHVRAEWHVSVLLVEQQRRTTLADLALHKQSATFIALMAFHLSWVLGERGRPIPVSQLRTFVVEASNKDGAAIVDELRAMPNDRKPHPDAAYVVEVVRPGGGA